MTPCPKLNDRKKHKNIFKSSSDADISSGDINQTSILIVDDEKNFLESLRFIFTTRGYPDLTLISDSREVSPLLKTRSFSVILLDITMPCISGLDLLDLVIRETPETPVIMITARNEVSTAVACIKAGAFDYLVKPVDEERLFTTLELALELTRLRLENRLLKNSLSNSQLKQPKVFEQFTTQNNALIKTFFYIEVIADSQEPVLITGETGTGKEFAAKAVHDASTRKGPFIPVNIAGLSEHLFDDTLFGHQKGAFTGADIERKGLIEEANGGTLFLDEIGDLSPLSQVKLLRLIQDRKYRVLGGNHYKNADVKIVAATHHHLLDRVKKGEFRNDLYYRLSVHHIHLPPLRERLEDLPLLIDAFLEQASLNLKRKKPTPPWELYTLLSTYSFPGNIRELRSMVFDAVARHSQKVMSLSVFKERIGLFPDKKDSLPFNPEEGENKIRFGQTLPTLKEAEEILIKEALKACQGNQNIASGILGLTRKALNSRLIRKKT